jgi:hypothetical protein
LPFSGQFCPNIARGCCEILCTPQVIRLRIQGFRPMTRSPDAAGFDGRAALVASSGLTHAVAASLALGAVSLCLIVTLTVLSTKIAMAMPIPA